MSERVRIDQAIRNIRRSCDNATRSPFFFIVGAGISVPSIKSSSEITAECAERYARERARDPTLDPPHMAPGPGLEAYSYFFNLAFPEAQERARFLEAMIHGAPISGATMRFAHLLSSGRVSRLVVTPNFDDLLTRALTLFGESPIVCDHPYTTGRIDPERSDVIQIVHVHGTYWFYDCCNLKDEIVAQAQPTPAGASMQQFLALTLRARSPIVVGYSGWEDDVIMGSLRRRLHERLPYHIYWFCYSLDNYAELPAWLKASGEVRFVVPDREDSVVRAQEIFDALNTALDLPEPRLTADPLRFFAERLQEEVASAHMPTTLADRSGTTLDLYDFASVISKIERAQALLRRETSVAEEIIEALRSAVRRSDYAGVISLAGSLTPTTLLTMNTEQLESLIATIEVAVSESGSLVPHVAAHSAEIVVDAWKQLAARGSIAATEETLGRALIHWGRALRRAGEDDVANTAFGEALALCGEESSPEFEPLLAEALFFKSVFRLKAGAAGDAAEGFATVIERYGASQEQETMRVVAMAWRELLRLDFDSGSTTRAMARFDAFLEHFGHSTAGAVAIDVALAFRDTITALNENKRYSDAVTLGVRWRKNASAYRRDDYAIEAISLLINLQTALAAWRCNRIRLAEKFARAVISMADRAIILSASEHFAAAYEILVHCLVALDRTDEARSYVAASFETFDHVQSSKVNGSLRRIVAAVAEP